MRTNGFISFAEPLLEEFDTYGNPIENSTQEWCEPLPCSIVTVSDSRIGKYEDGVFQQSSYSITVENSFVFNQKAKIAKLQRDENELGVFRIQSIEEYKTVGRIIITV